MNDGSQLPSVVKAELPALYQSAKTALAKCEKIDECKDWANKAAAMASYAKQSLDDTLFKHATRIQLRAVRRCGELMKQIERANGARTDLQPGGRKSPKLTRKAAGRAAGLSDDQRKTALRVASVPAKEFNEMVDSDNPPTVTALAEIGTLHIEKPRQFFAATHTSARCVPLWSSVTDSMRISPPKDYRARSARKPANS